MVQGAISELGEERTAEKAVGGKGRRLTRLKRQMKELGGRKKRLKHKILTNWGEKQPEGAADVGGANQPLKINDDEELPPVAPITSSEPDGRTVSWQTTVQGNQHRFLGGGRIKEVISFITPSI